MKQIPPKYERILAIAPSSRGVGFAVLDGRETLADWGVKSVKGDKNIESLKKIEALIVHYQPTVMILEDASSKDSRRSPRIRTLCKRIARNAAKHKVKVTLISRQKVMQAYFADGQGTKHALAEILAGQFPEELTSRLPPKRKAWMSEDPRMGIFDAVALALSRLQKQKNQT